MKKKIFATNLSAFTFFFLISIASIIFGSRIEVIETNKQFFPTFKVSNNMMPVFAQEGTETTEESTEVDPSSSEARETASIVQPIRITEATIVKLLTLVLIGVLVLIVILLSPVAGFKFWVEDEENLDSKARFLSDSFPTLLQGITVILIVMVVTILTLSGFVKEQGTISILSALIGYVLGRKSAESEESQAKALLDKLDKLTGSNSETKEVPSDTLIGDSSDQLTDSNSETEEVLPDTLTGSN